MHVGRSWPYLTDRWACSSQWWSANTQGFIPRKQHLEFLTDIVFHPNPQVAYDDISDEGVVAGDRESVSYDFPATADFTSVNITVQTLGAWPNKFTRWLGTYVPTVGPPIWSIADVGDPSIVTTVTGIVLVRNFAPPFSGAPFWNNWLIQPALWAEL